jgi:hypothetical protein
MYKILYTHVGNPIRLSIASHPLLDLLSYSHRFFLERFNKVSKNASLVTIGKMINAAIVDHVSNTQKQINDASDHSKTFCFDLITLFFFIIK